MTYSVAAQNRQMFDGVVAMRRALKYDPDALNRVSVDDRLRREIHELTENYQSRFHGLSASDTHFMTTSLNYLMNDLDRESIGFQNGNASIQGSWATRINGSCLKIISSITVSPSWFSIFHLKVLKAFIRNTPPASRKGMLNIWPVLRKKPNP